MKINQIIKNSLAIAVVSLALCNPSWATYTPDFMTEATCLASNIYFEARGESLKGQIAVAMVTINRVASDDFPDTICEVVHEGKHKDKCQFSWYCDNKSDELPKGTPAANLAMVIAVATLTTPMTDITEGALYFHVPKTKSHKHLENAIEIGAHIFYRGR